MWLLPEYVNIHMYKSEWRLGIQICASSQIGSDPNTPPHWHTCIYFKWFQTDISKETQREDIYFLKAFDGCIHKKIWLYLSRHCVKGNFLCIFDCMYRKLKAWVRVGGLTYCSVYQWNSLRLVFTDMLLMFYQWLSYLSTI